MFARENYQLFWIINVKIDVLKTRCSTLARMRYLIDRNVHNNTTTYLWDTEVDIYNKIKYFKDRDFDHNKMTYLKDEDVDIHSNGSVSFQSTCAFFHLKYVKLTS